MTNILNFARSHDWGKSAFVSQDAVMVFDEEHDAWIAFRSMQTLRNWAGY